MNRAIFRKYDIRGIFPEDLDADTVRRLGWAAGLLSGGGNGTLAVGRDCRLSGGRIFEWFSGGASGTGCRVLDLGIQTTPMTYFAAHLLAPDATAMITGSHNPPAYNGFKLMKGLHTLHDGEIQEIRDLAESAPPEEHPAGTVERVSVADRYAERLVSEFAFERSFTVVVDAGNGTGGGIACRLLEALGCRVVPLFCEMEGSFPNHHPDPTIEENLAALKREVVERRADLGIAFDGDADRLGLVDDRGRTVFGDRTLVLLARSLLETYPGSTVLSEVKASSVFFSEVEKAGGRPVMCPTGHSIIKEAMAREGALLAGEMSGHIFFRDRYYGYDDALYAALRLLELLSRSGRRLSDLLDTIPPMHSTPEIREDCSEEHKFEIVDRIRRSLSGRYRVTDIDGVRVDFPHGWGLVRASNTQPVLVLRFEADDPGEMRKYEALIRSEIEDAKRGLDVQGAH